MLMHLVKRTALKAQIPRRSICLQTQLSAVLWLKQLAKATSQLSMLPASTNNTLSTSMQQGYYLLAGLSKPWTFTFLSREIFTTCAIVSFHDEVYIS